MSLGYSMIILLKDVNIPEGWKSKIGSNDGKITGMMDKLNN